MGKGGAIKNYLLLLGKALCIQSSTFNVLFYKECRSKQASRQQ